MFFTLDNAEFAGRSEAAREKLTDIANQALVQQPKLDWQRDVNLREAFLAEDPEVLDALRRVGIGHVNEMGTLFIALAGLMNLVVILDALYITVDRDTGAVIRGARP